MAQDFSTVLYIQILYIIISCSNRYHLFKIFFLYIFIFSSWEHWTNALLVHVSLHDYCNKEICRHTADTVMNLHSAVIGASVWLANVSHFSYRCHTGTGQSPSLACLMSQVDHNCLSAMSSLYRKMSLAQHSAIVSLYCSHTAYNKRVWTN